jgi:hypothetical protein
LHLQLARNIEAILTEAAKRPHESTSFQTPTQLSDKVVEISMTIRASIKKLTLNEPAREEAMQAVVTSLKRDSIKCQTLLTSQLSADDFVRGILKPLRPDTTSHQEPNSSSSNEIDDIGQVCSSQHSQPSLPFPISSFTDPTAVVEKTQRSADSVNCLSLSSSTSQPDSTVITLRKFDLLLPSELEDYLKLHDINNHGCRQELIARCEAKEQKLIAQRSSAREVLAAQNEEQPTKEVANPDELRAEARSVSSDGPLPEESQFKRMLRSLLPY